MNSDDLAPAQWKDILEWGFQVPSYPDVYVLGCFNRHVTLYAQQVRALNLITGLVETKVISKDRKVAVIGGGAAGLTAAAAAAKHGAKVVLLEQLEGIMELQGNNRQRFVHPYIYYWPNIDPQKHVADVPLLSWGAGYAMTVAETIEEEWTTLRNMYGIEVHYGVHHVFINKQGDGTVSLNWTETDKAPTLYEHVIILAVGFGLEEDSYWKEDDIDGSFRPIPKSHKWLISGFGDGAFTDVMRLCIRRFRQAQIMQLFENARGIKEIKEELIKIHSDPDLSPATLTKKFDELAANNSFNDLTQVLSSRLRTNRPQLFLAGENMFLYGPKASILNRLVVSVLKLLGQFTLLRGPTDLKSVQKSGDLYKVRLGPPGEETEEEFNRIIVRHGPKPSLRENNFVNIWNACEDLKNLWFHHPLHRDITRTKLWPDGFFGPEQGSAMAVSTSSATPKSVVVVKTEREEIYDQAAKKYGVKIAALEMRKRIRNDGVSTIEYVVNELSALSGTIVGMRFYYESTFGQVGTPELDQESQKARFSWSDDAETFPEDKTDDFDVAMQTIRRRAKKMAGIVKFPAPLTPADPPLSFSLTVTALNSDALSSWEFDQLYDHHERSHVDGVLFEHATEYMARLVWVPVANLKLTITLPSRTPGPAFPSLFLANDHKSIPVEEVVNQEVLYMYPRQGSTWQLSGSKWERKAADVLVQENQFRNVAPQTWELSVPYPIMGSCYSIDWQLPSSSDNAIWQSIADETLAFRKALLDYREKRRRNAANPAIQEIFDRFFAQLTQQYCHNPDERFVITVLTYDAKDRHLKLVDGTVNGHVPGEDMWKFWLPYGSGLAGACFKQQVGNPLIYYAPQPGETRKGPEAYLPIPNRDHHKILLALPLDHPDARNRQESSFESAKLRLGVLDLGSDSEKSELFNLDREQLKKLASSIDEFCGKLCEVLLQGMH